MERKYWEKIAPDYNEQIFDVLLQDKKAIVSKELRKLSQGADSVIDIGCAVGKWLPLLSSLFRSVMAVDISQKNLDLAAKTYADLANVDYQRMDMSKALAVGKTYDVGLCVNAILSSSIRKRDTFFSNFGSLLNPGGHLVLVVPSVESWLLTRTIQHKFQIDKKLFSEKLSDREAASRYRNMQQGNVEIDNVATKHYLGEEIEMLLAMEGFEVLKRKQINYDWRTEFVAPPSWLKEPRPWDWFAVARKK